MRFILDVRHENIILSSFCSHMSPFLSVTRRALGVIHVSCLESAPVTVSVRPLSPVPHPAEHM